MLANLRRKIGMSQTPQPQTMQQQLADGSIVTTYIDPALASGPPPPLTMEELGFNWPIEGGNFSPSAIPLWLQEGVSSHSVPILAI